MQSSNSIITIIVLAVASVFAIFLGSSIGSEDQQTPMMFLGGFIVLALIFGMGRNLWILLLLFWPLTGRIAVLPLPFSVSNLVVMLVLAGALMMIPLGGFPFRGRLSFLDLMVILIVADIALVFGMNPVGLSSLKSDTVGSRPYFEAGLGVMAYIVLRNQALVARNAKPIIVGILITAALLSFGKTLSYLVPPVGYTLYAFYTDFVPQIESMVPDEINLVGASRQSYLLDISQAILLCLVAFSNPLRSMLPTRPLHFALFLFAAAGILVSGFRSLLVLAAVYVIIGAFVWGGGRALVASFFIGATGLLLVYAVNMVTPLPLSMQRAMSFLPGDWDSEAVREAQGSLEWRFEMWQQALGGDELIQNKVVGDGFGFSSSELEIMQAARQGVGNFDRLMHEHMMLAGGFHSGPISSLRFVGAVGLLIFVVFVTVLAVKMWGLIDRARDTPLFPICLYFGIPMVFMPVYFLFVFGGYEAALPNSLYAAGVFQMLKNSLADYKETAKVPARQTVLEPAGHVALARSSG